MPRDPARVADARAWLTKAKLDVEAAQHDLRASPPFVSDVIFHRQQAVEKALEGFLAWHDVPFRKTRELYSVTGVLATASPISAVEFFPAGSNKPSRRSAVSRLILQSDLATLLLASSLVSRRTLARGYGPVSTELLRKHKEGRHR